MAWFPALEVFAGLAFTFGVLPRILFPRPRIARGTVDRIIIDAIRMAAFIVVVVHVLVPLQLFQWTGLLLFGIVWIYVVRLRPAGWNVNRFYTWASLHVRAYLYLLEAGSREGNLRVKEGVRTWARTQVIPRVRPRRPAPRTVAVCLLSLPLIAVLAGSLFVRIAHPLGHAAFAASDGYVHLAWLKYIFAGELFRDGVYPHGMHALLGFTAKVTSPTNYHMLRFTGPVLNTGIVFLAYWLVVRATKHAGLGLVTAALIGVAGMRPEIGLPDYRQVGTLPQEIALLAAMLGLVQAVEYALRPQRSRLVYLAMAGFVVAMTHPLAVGVILVVGPVAGLVAALRNRRVADLVRASAAAFAGTIAGHAYLVAALVFRVPMYSAVNANPIATSAVGGQARPTASLLAGSPTVRVALVGALVALAWSAWRVRRSPHFAAAATLAGVILACAAAQLVGSVVLRGWYAERWGEVVKPLLPIGVVIGLAPVAALLLWVPERVMSRLRNRPSVLLARAGAAVSAGTLATVVIVAAMPPVIGHPKYNSEYESSARVLGTQMRANERFSYTMVGPPSWYDRVLGSGYHVHLMDFADRLDIRDASDPSFDLPIATEKVYVLTEKIPFRFNFNGTVRGGVERYFNVETRGEMMRTVDTWMRTYADYHGNTDIAYEDRYIRLWRIKHPPNYEYTKRFGLTDPEDLPQPDTHFALGGPGS